MKKYKTEQIRNIALTGHSGSGKTSLVEAFLYKSGGKERLGKVEEKNTTSDFNDQEIKRLSSINTSIIPVEYENKKINFIDTPGSFDYFSEVKIALRAAEATLITVDASAGIEVGTEKVLDYTEEFGLPRMIFLNKMEKENAKFNEIVAELRSTYSNRMIPFTLTLGEAEDFTGIIDVLNKKAYEYDGFERKEVEIPEIRKEEVDVVYTEIVEAIAETDDELMEKYFEGEEFTHEELMEGILSAVMEGLAVPIVAGSAQTGAGIDILLDEIVKYMPAPNDERAHSGFRPAGEETRAISVDDPFSAMVFKTYSDPYVGKISIVKVLSGVLKEGMEVLNINKEETEKIGSVHFLRGKEQLDAEEVVAGDIAAISKLSVTQTGDTLSDKKEVMEYKPLKVDKANYYIAIEPVSKNDEDRIGSALQKLHEEDPSFIIDRNQETNQLTIGGFGSVQLQIILERLKEEYNVDTNIIPLKIAYRETIKGKSDVQGRHKRQSGGAGQFGDVFIRFEPFVPAEYAGEGEVKDDFVFEEEVFGGAVPRNFFPAVEKGLREKIKSGVLAGFPVVNVKAVLYDGSHHPVDSNEMAFISAAHLAFNKGIPEANPVLLEPVMKVEVEVPENYMGDIMGDINRRRGRVLGMEQLENGNQLIVAEAPHSELFEYAIDLRSMTQSRGSFDMEFEKYEEVPREISEKLIEELNKEI